MKISAEDLIKICDKYLDGEIDQNYILVFAENILSDENIDFENEIVYDIIIQWHNPYISFEINNLNMKLWKHYLLTGEDKLIEYNSWNIHIEPQKKSAKNIILNGNQSIKN
ncbi:hypothetical protein PG357_03175 [Riemerella anatipestifer]|nr:hypothetical protein [Riemerella anatipestifer]